MCRIKSAIIATSALLLIGCNESISDIISREEQKIPLIDKEISFTRKFENKYLFEPKFKGEYTIFLYFDRLSLDQNIETFHLNGSYHLASDKFGVIHSSTISASFESVVVGIEIARFSIKSKYVDRSFMLNIAIETAEKNLMNHYSKIEIVVRKKVKSIIVD